MRAEHGELGTRWLCADGAVPVLVTENETNNERVFGTANDTPYVKDGIDRAVVHGDAAAVNPDGTGTKAALHYVLTVPAGGTATLRLRLTDTDPGAARRRRPFARLRPGDDRPPRRGRRVLGRPCWPATSARTSGWSCRQALAGMLWSKQYYALDVERWLAEHGVDPLDGGTGLRNEDWRHLVAEDIISMPDKWEYPWFAAWDLAFHTVALAVVDLPFAKQQLELLLSRRYLHPNGQLPAYEWNFSDVNPPVHAWAVWFVYQLEKATTGAGGPRLPRGRLPEAGAQLRLVAEPQGHGQPQHLPGRLPRPRQHRGLRPQRTAAGRRAHRPGRRHRVDGPVLREHDADGRRAGQGEPGATWSRPSRCSRTSPGSSRPPTRSARARSGLWDEEDGFFYDVLRRPDGSSVPLKVRSVVGLMPLAAATVIGALGPRGVPGAGQGRRPSSSPATPRSPPPCPAAPGRWRRHGPVLLAMFDENRLRRILARMLDEEEFLGPHGIRAVSRYHAAHPYVLNLDGQEYRVGYLPAESDTGMFGGNSNWRGPVWFPINVMLVRALMNLYGYFGDGFTVECPTGSGRQCNLYEVARELGDRLTGTFLRDPAGRRPVHGGQPILQDDPHWRDLILFYEYFHGDNGAGIGASHQTGWTGTVALLPLLFRGVHASALVNWRGGAHRVGTAPVDSTVPSQRASADVPEHAAEV